MCWDFFSDHWTNIIVNILYVEWKRELRLFFAIFIWNMYVLSLFLSQIFILTLFRTLLCWKWAIYLALSLWKLHFILSSPKTIKLKRKIHFYFVLTSKHWGKNCQRKIQFLFTHFLRLCKFKHHLENIYIYSTHHERIIITFLFYFIN